MPKRNKIDPNLVLKTYVEVKNAREVARRLQVAEVTVYQILKRFKGECRFCSNKVQPGEIHCPECKKKVAEARKVKRAEAKRSGRCVSCNEPRMPGSRLYCEACLIKHNQRNERYADRCKAKTNSGLTQNLAQKLRHVRYSYGEEAVKLWIEQDGTCLICGRKHGENKVVVHIHHIDENKDNNSGENLTLLCFECHSLITKILAHPELIKLLDWTKQTYPFLFPQNK